MVSSRQASCVCPTPRQDISCLSPHPIPRDPLGTRCLSAQTSCGATRRPSSGSRGKIGRGCSVSHIYQRLRDTANQYNSNTSCRDDASESESLFPKMQDKGMVECVDTNTAQVLGILQASRQTLSFCTTSPLVAGGEFLLVSDSYAYSPSFIPGSLSSSSSSR